MTLEELREALKKATGKDVDNGLDLAIHELLVERRNGLKVPFVIGNTYYTTSIDAAVTLVPKGASRTIYDPGDYDGELKVWFNMPNEGPLPPRHEAIGATIPLALCLARVEYEIAKRASPSLPVQDGKHG